MGDSKTEGNIETTVLHECHSKYTIIWL